MESITQISCAAHVVCGQERNRRRSSRCSTMSTAGWSRCWGQGGIGKTRLALKAAEALMQAGRRGRSVPLSRRSLPLVSLQPAASAAQIVSAIIRRARLASPEQGNPHGRTACPSARQRLLLILDNFEHLVAEAALMQEFCTAPNVQDRRHLARGRSTWRKVALCRGGHGAPRRRRGGGAMATPQRATP